VDLLARGEDDRCGGRELRLADGRLVGIPDRVGAGEERGAGAGGRERGRARRVGEVGEREAGPGAGHRAGVPQLRGAGGVLEDDPVGGLGVVGVAVAPGERRLLGVDRGVVDRRGGRRGRQRGDGEGDGRRRRGGPVGIRAKDVEVVGGAVLEVRPAWDRARGGLPAGLRQRDGPRVVHDRPADLRGDRVAIGLHVDRRRVGVEEAPGRRERRLLAGGRDARRRVRPLAGHEVLPAGVAAERALLVGDPALPGVGLPRRKGRPGVGLREGPVRDLRPRGVDDAGIPHLTAAAVGRGVDDDLVLVEGVAHVGVGERALEGGGQAGDAPAGRREVGGGIRRLVIRRSGVREVHLDLGDAVGGDLAGRGVDVGPVRAGIGRVYRVEVAAETRLIQRRGLVIDVGEEAGHGQQVPAAVEGLDGAFDLRTPVGNDPIGYGRDVLRPVHRIVDRVGRRGRHDPLLLAASPPTS
jgi:hypothetical protein